MLHDAPVINIVDIVHLNECENEKPPFRSVLTTIGVAVAVTNEMRTYNVTYVKMVLFSGSFNECNENIIIISYIIFILNVTMDHWRLVPIYQVIYTTSNSENGIQVLFANLNDFRRLYFIVYHIILLLIWSLMSMNFDINANWLWWAVVIRFECL